MRIMLLAFLLVFSSVSRAQPYDFTTFGPRLSGDYQLSMSAFLPPDRLRLQEIRAQIPHLQSYEDFLDYIAERRPVLFENPVLIHDSGSLQYSDRERPRVILFGDGLMLAFAEDPRREERTVEVIAFDELSQGFQFAELQFGADGARFQDQPRNCQSCHGTTPKPLWDPYDFWPNAYGSAIARFGTVAEKNAYEKIRQQTPKQGIYQRLKWPVPTGNNNRGLDGIETFTQYVNQLQIFAALPRLQQQPGAFDQVVPALLGVLNHCAVDANDANAARKLAAFFPGVWQSRIQTEFAGWHQRVKEARRRLKSYQSNRYQKLFPNSPTLFAIDLERLAAETQTVAQFYFILDLAGVDARDFTLSQGPNPYFMSVPSNLDADLASNMALVAPDIFQRLSPKLVNANGGGYDFTWARFNCASLQTESLQQLQGMNPTAPANTGFRNAPTVFGECMSCHTINPAAQGAPPIPFDSSGQLRVWLQGSDGAGMKKILERIQKTGPGQMPPYRKLSREEQEQLRLNLEHIGS
ncbi:cytochrome c [Oligoflexus tunisiensis]|uniref:cytochrome c n=1 Tax=Oligoflexus tunisiensis TaxID=708132 RepID=UPI00114CE283|nr:cytochrome c [Oligoflexus tunisiensis]